jgi:hypothetical protein
MAGRSLENCPNRKVEGSIPLPSATLLHLNHGGSLKLHDNGVITITDGKQVVGYALLPEDLRKLARACNQLADIGAGG